jgi:hypothetical protein
MSVSILPKKDVKEVNQEPKKNKTKEQRQKKVSQECLICAETVSKIKCISCPYCSFECCKKCVETFLIGIDDDFPRCMSSTCKKVWSLSFIATNFTKIFFNKHYRDRRSFLLIEKEKSRLPEAQKVLEERKRIAFLYNEVNNTQMVINKLSLQKLQKAETEEKKKEITDKITEYTEKIRYIYIQINNPVVVKEKKQVIMKCPVDDCRGFVNDENGEGIHKCGVCEVVVCKKCRVVKKDADHNCDTNILATIKMLANDTKNCPKCSTPIFKINGCDQMYCTQCHTAFSWLRGTIETGIIHNPHFYEYQRRMNNGVAPRVLGDEVGNNCDGIPQWSAIYMYLDYSYQSDMLITAHSMIGHIEDIIMYHLYNLERYNEETLELRVDYLKNRLDETKWLDILKKKQKKVEKDEEVRQVLRMVVNTFCDIFRNFIASVKDPFDRSVFKCIEETAENLDKVCVYANDALSVIEKQYNNIVPYFGRDCRMYQSYKMCPPKEYR